MWDTERLPIHSLEAWIKIIGILCFLLLINVVAFFVTFMWGVLVTIPLTLFVATLLLRDVLPRNVFPRALTREGIPP